MALRIEPIEPLAISLDWCGISPQRVGALSLSEIQRLEVFHGRERVEAGELFCFIGDPGDGELHLVGDFSQVAGIGAGMIAGTIRVEGDVGPYAGSEMSGGTLIIEGNAGDRLGCQMSGGRIWVHGDAGNFAGGAFSGSLRGMSGGELFIDGNVAADLGRAMRRGMIAVGESAGDALGANMIAGSILVFGACGSLPGAGMRRGTIALFSAPPPIPLTFRPGSRGQPIFMRLLLNYLHREGMQFDFALMDTALQTFHGDFLHGGKGEILAPLEFTL
jgi:formylmethanofuran dehydrogenase subunit C